MSCGLRRLSNEKGFMVIVTINTVESDVYMGALYKGQGGSAIVLADSSTTKTRKITSGKRSHSSPSKTTAMKLFAAHQGTGDDAAEPGVGKNA
ncbi:hypothetical protein BS78_K318900 [Paspalum vaginatum]|uniref:Uncharacterized protein n=1 Tax=Paspalum vaginatum TaxID=158149 RepID=A0A9W7XB33_9POAL|nr:hypothetical protein BS78_K318900 [Paspalum vaginatum]